MDIRPSLVQKRILAANRLALTQTRSLRNPKGRARKPKLRVSDRLEDLRELGHRLIHANGWYSCSQCLGARKRTGLCSWIAQGECPNTQDREFQIGETEAPASPREGDDNGIAVPNTRRRLLSAGGNPPPPSPPPSGTDPLAGRVG